MSYRPVYRATWQEQMKIRAYRLLGWVLPLMLASFAITASISRVPQRELAAVDWNQTQTVTARVQMPNRSSDEIQTLFTIEGKPPMPPPRSLSVQVRNKDGSFDTKKRWKFAAKAKKDKSWIALFPMKMPAGELIQIRIANDSAPLAAGKVRVIIDPERQVDRYLRYGEIFFYPALTLCLMGMAMVIFAKMNST